MTILDDWKEEYELYSDEVTFRKPLCRIAHIILAYMIVIWADVNCREPIINCWSKTLDIIYKAVIDFLSLLDEIVLYGHRIVLTEEGQKFVDGFMRAFTDGLYTAASMGLFNDDDDE